MNLRSGPGPHSTSGSQPEQARCSDDTELLQILLQGAQAPQHCPDSATLQQSAGNSERVSHSIFQDSQMKYQWTPLLLRNLLDVISLLWNYLPQFIEWASYTTQKTGTGGTSALHHKLVFCAIVRNGFVKFSFSFFFSNQLPSLPGEFLKYSYIVIGVIVT